MKTLRTFLKTARLAYKEKMLGMIFLHILSLLTYTALYTGALVYEKNLIDKIYQVNQHGIKAVVISILIFFLLKNLINVVYTIRYLLKVVMGPKFDLAMRTRMYEKISRMNLVYFEYAELFNLIEKAKYATFHAVISFEIVYHTVLSHFASVIGITVYLTYLNPWFILIMVFAAIPQILNFAYRGRKKLQLENEQTPYKRQNEYYQNCITGQQFFKETRLFGSFDYFKGLWANSQHLLHTLEWTNSLQLLPMELLINGVNWLAYIGTFSLAIFYLYQGEISIGGFAAVLSALAYLNEKIGKVLANSGKAIESSTIASNYFTFMELDEKNTGDQKMQIHPIESICFENVNFAYPSVERNVIHDLSLTIQRGETIAVVGLNGAGKTTFVKLLLGLLTPTSGRVLYNGIDLTTLADESIHPGTSALFQTFGKYMISLRENIAISQATRIDDTEAVEGALKFTDFLLDQERFPRGIETILGREFGGTDLSGGQWQLLALARAYFRENDLIILDEPTAAIDPILENQIFINFQKMCQGKTGIIVTHRLGAAQIADRIIVFEQGQIIEDGSHAELMQARGKYAQLYQGQSNWYHRHDLEETGT